MGRSMLQLVSVGRSMTLGALKKRFSPRHSAGADWDSDAACGQDGAGMMQVVPPSPNASAVNLADADDTIAEYLDDFEDDVHPDDDEEAFAQVVEAEEALAALAEDPEAIAAAAAAADVAGASEVVEADTEAEAEDEAYADDFEEEVNDGGPPSPSVVDETSLRWEASAVEDGGVMAEGARDTGGGSGVTDQGSSGDARRGAGPSSSGEAALSGSGGATDGEAAKDEDLAAAAVARGPPWRVIRWEELEVGALIAKGAMGAVHAAQWEGRAVAAKTLHDTSAAQLAATECELLVHASIAHRNVVTLHGASLEPPGCCIVMERCECSLFERLHRQSRDLDRRKMVGIGRQVRYSSASEY